MSYRDDHDATFARLAVLEREAKQLEAENERLTAELATAKEWLGGPRKKALLATVTAGWSVVMFGVGMTVGANIWGGDTATPTAIAAASAPRPAPLPQVFGIVVADGPEVGHWTLNATRCAIREDGVELTATGSDGHSVWVADGQVEIELPGGALRLEKKHCWGRYQQVLDKLATTPPTIDGFVELDCAFGDNRVQGRIEIRACR